MKWHLQPILICNLTNVLFSMISTTKTRYPLTKLTMVYLDNISVF